MQKNSFTLVELLIVLVIVAILAMLAVAISQKMIERAEVRQAVTDLGALRKAELAYYQETGGYYTSSNWLPAPVPPDGGLSYSMWTGSFPPDFPITKSNKLFTYKAMKEFGWEGAVPGNFHVGAYKRSGRGAGGIYYYMDVETGKLYKCRYPYIAENVEPYE